MITPTTWKVSPRDSDAVPGEQGLVGLLADDTGRAVRALVIDSHEPLPRLYEAVTTRSADSGHGATTDSAGTPLPCSTHSRSSTQHIGLGPALGGRSSMGGGIVPPPGRRIVTSSTVDRGGGPRIARVAKSGRRRVPDHRDEMGDRKALARADDV